MEQVKDKDGRLFVYLHANKTEQNNFIQEAVANDCFAHPIPFMIRQAERDIITKKLYHKGKEVTDTDTDWFFNGARPCLTVSNANPDAGLPYCNWTYLESIIESGWRKQFITF